LCWMTFADERHCVGPGSGGDFRRVNGSPE
jgi:hypothetical protein